jgi:hypothetical protein
MTDNKPTKMTPLETPDPNVSAHVATIEIPSLKSAMATVDKIGDAEALLVGRDGDASENRDVALLMAVVENATKLSDDCQANINVLIGQINELALDRDEQFRRIDIARAGIRRAKRIELKA